MQLERLMWNKVGGLVIGFSTAKVKSIKYISMYLEIHQIYFHVFRITPNNCLP